MAKLIEPRYGKARVRVLKILRTGALHTVLEIEVTALLSGDFESSYTAGDNSKVVPTDTIKNTINALAKEQLGEEIENFAAFLGQHFIRRYEQVRRAAIEISERGWDRLEISGKPHPHSFREAGAARNFTRAICTAQSCEVDGGIRELVILKSTGLGFENYPRCEYTTLPETADRILATSLSGTWRYAKTPGSYRAANAEILAAMLKVFAENFSPSAQTTLFQMAEAALAICPEISRIDLSMPNKHYLSINLSPFGLENKISARIRRRKSRLVRWRKSWRCYDERVSKICATRRDELLECRRVVIPIGVFAEQERSRGIPWNLGEALVLKRRDPSAPLRYARDDRQERNLYENER